MNVAIFSAKKYDREFLNAANGSLHELRFFEPQLNEETAGLATGFEAVCVFVNDHVDAAVIAKLRSLGVRLIALRCAGYNNVDLPAATRHRITVVRVPAYSPYAVAEHTIALMLALNRKMHRAYNRVREGNFALDGLVGFDMHGKTVGVIGTGQIGAVVAQILTGFGSPTLAVDPFPNAACRSLGVRYVELNELLAQSDIITLHCPLTPQTRGMIAMPEFRAMKCRPLIINTARGGLVDEVDLVQALDEGLISGAGFDVAREEPPPLDSPLMQVAKRPNVILTPHVAWASNEAQQALADQLISNIENFVDGRPTNLVEGAY